MGILNGIFKSKPKNNYRNSPRRIKQILFQVTGQDENGFSLAEQAYTKVVTRSGGCLVLKSDVGVGGQIIIKSENGVSFLVEIRSYKYDAMTNHRQIGFQVVRPLHRWQQTVLDKIALSSAPAPGHPYSDNNWMR
jgi:hypothetical protein